MKRLHYLFLAGTFLLWTAAPGWALFGLVPTLKGTVKTVGTDMIIVTDKTSKDISLDVNDKTKLISLASLTDLKEGDQVKVDYKEEGDKKIATTIAKEETPVTATAPSAVDATGKPDTNAKSQPSGGAY